MSNTIEIQPVDVPFDATVRVPGSKSITNRALALAAMAVGNSDIKGILYADDTRKMLDSLAKLGLVIHADESTGKTEMVGNCGQFSETTADLFCGNSGTTIRFLTALCAASTGRYILDGIPRMRQRPIGELGDALAALGANIEYLGQTGFPPIRTTGTGLIGGTCRFAATRSSQYISAILMAAPLARTSVEIFLDGPVTSEPYVEMTLNMMDQFGAEFVQDVTDHGRVIRITGGQHYKGRTYIIEPDASNASYFLAAAAVIPGARVTIPGLGNKSLQGDVAFAEVLKQMGAIVEIHDDKIIVCGTDRLTGISINMNNIPDMVQTLAVLALFAKGPTHITHVGNLRLKETDRLAALEAELTRLGANVKTTVDSIHIAPPQTLYAADIKTYDDHRMAMAFAVAGLRATGIRITDPDCCAKTYPEFFRDLRAMAASRRIP